ncbi:MAG: trypsin-like serine protease [Campylobacterales bacterium]|nr:trypsin-like serine protease [Campylobacterales bacterium]
MWKSCFILLFSFKLFAQSLIDQGDYHFVRDNFIEAIGYYKQAHEQQVPKAKIKLIMCYIKLGDNFKKIRNYEKSLEWYNKAQELKSEVAKVKISAIFELLGDQYHRIKEYEKAYEYYQKSIDLGNASAKVKLKKVERFIKHQQRLENDTREIVTNKAPSWTKSIGRIIVPTKLEFLNQKQYKTNQKKCTATLVSLDPRDDSSTILTASHCLSEYDPSAGMISFMIKDSDNQIIYTQANVVFDSKYDKKQIHKKSDLAILKLEKPIPNTLVKPMLVSKLGFQNIQNKYKYSYSSVAGFSSDIGEYGALLSYDPLCEIANFNKFYGKSNCKGFQGSSGGPVVLSVTNDGKIFEYYHIGVISHYKNKEFEKIFFALDDPFFEQIIQAIQD